MEMKPGRELDALIAEKVMGFGPELYQPRGVGYRPDTWVYAINDYKQDGVPVYVVDCPSYSTDIGDAWRVVERLSLPFEMWSDDERDAYRVRFDLDRGKWLSAHSAPHAICLAALKAVGG